MILRKKKKQQQQLNTPILVQQADLGPAILQKTSTFDSIIFPLIFN